jgi:hypothetical protein
MVRAPGAIALMVIGLFLAKRIVHESIAGGAMGFLLYPWRFRSWE